MEYEEIFLSVGDRNERLVTLSWERWRHITSRHPEIADLLADVVRAVEEPTDVRPGKAPDEEWLFLEGAGPSASLKVVLVWDEPEYGRIITAYPRREKP